MSTVWRAEAPANIALIKYMGKLMCRAIDPPTPRSHTLLII